MNPDPNSFNQTQNAATSQLSSASVNATPLKEFTDFDQGDLVNILHDLRDTVRDLSHRMNTGLTPAAAGISMAGRQGSIPPPIRTMNSRLYPAAAPGPYAPRGSNVHDDPPHLSKDKYIPPHRNSQAQSRFNTNSFPEIPLREPNPIPSIRFSGACIELETFLLDIREQLRIFSDCFSTDKARINWVAHHFGIKDKKVGTTSYTWFMGLLKQNAYEQGAVTSFQDYYALPYVLKPLTTLAEFFGEMVAVFSDKEADATARKALNACKQGDSSISNYNNRFLSLVFTVPLTEESRMLQYVEGLHPDLLYCCNFQQGWSTILTLSQKMTVASDAAKVLDSILSLKTTNIFNPRRPGHFVKPQHLHSASHKQPVQFGIPV